MKRKVCKHKLLFFITFCLIAGLNLYFSGCGGGSSETSSLTETGITLAWDAPTKRTDGSSLSGLAGFKVYYGNSTRQYNQSVDVGNVTTVTVDNLPLGPLYIAVTAYDVFGNESEYSEEISTDIN